MRPVPSHRARSRTERHVPRRASPDPRSRRRGRAASPVCRDRDSRSRRWRSRQRSPGRARVPAVSPRSRECTRRRCRPSSGPSPRGGTHRAARRDRGGSRLRRPGSADRPDRSTGRGCATPSSWSSGEQLDAPPRANPAARRREWTRHDRRRDRMNAGRRSRAPGRPFSSPAASRSRHPRSTRHRRTPRRAGSGGGGRRTAAPGRPAPCRRGHAPPVRPSRSDCDRQPDGEQDAEDELDPGSGREHRE